MYNRLPVLKSGTAPASTRSSSNHDIAYALNYHESTKHSEISLRTSGHYLDWTNKPSQFKVYEDLTSISLPKNFPRRQAEPLMAISGRSLRTEPTNLGLAELTELFYFSAGLTRKYRFGGELHYMRAASATGALYPIELYVVAGDVTGLEAGVYHFDPLGFQISRIRKGDYRAELAAISNDSIAMAPAIIAFTSLAWRNAWKYEVRSYRHWFWDSGVIVANLLATSKSAGIATEAILGFVDSEIDQLLGLEAKKEATVALAVVGIDHNPKALRLRQPIPSLALEINPLSREEVDYSLIWETNEASQLRSKSEAEAWRKSLRLSQGTIPTTSPAFPLRAWEKVLSPPLDEVILIRGSTRKFAREPISFDHLSTILQSSATKIPLDFLPDSETLIDFYFIANDVQGIPPGSYFYNVNTNSVEKLKVLNNRTMSGYLCLGQTLFSDASVVFFLMTNLNSVLKSLGNRGYRAAQFEAGVRAGKIYLSSYTLGSGASGSTFFDDAVTEFFSPHAEEKSPMIAVGVGVPAYKARSGKVLPQMTTKC